MNALAHITQFELTPVLAIIGGAFLAGFFVGMRVWLRIRQ